MRGRLAAWSLFDLEDGGVALHDGHDDFVDVVLESVVDLFLFVDRLHQLQAERQKSEEKTVKTRNKTCPYPVVDCTKDIYSSTKLLF